MSISLGVVLLGNATWLNDFYRNGLVRLVLLREFIFMGIVVVIAMNHRDL
jgi:hypothetical protein